MKKQRQVWLLVMTILLLSTISLLTSCNGSPTILPKQSSQPIPKETMVVSATTPVSTTNTPLPVTDTPSTQNPSLTTKQSATTVSETPTPTLFPTGSLQEAETLSPISTIRVIDKTPLSLEGALNAAETKPSNFLIRGWTQEEGLILQTDFAQGNAVFWAVSPDTGQARQLTDWKPLTAQSVEVQATIEELKRIDPRINITSVSPDGQWAAGGAIDEPVLLVKKMGSDSPVVSLLSETKWGWFAQFMAWSPNSQRLAYAVGSPYEIRISNLNSSNTIVIKLWDTRPSPLIWSTDGRLLAFVVADEPQQPSDVYVVGADGANLINVTNDNVWISGPIAWSPDSRKIAYGNGSQVWLVEIAAE